MKTFHKRQKSQKIELKTFFLSFFLSKHNKVQYLFSKKLIKNVNEEFYQEVVFDDVIDIYNHIWTIV